jgi:hypothetical protein
MDDSYQLIDGHICNESGKQFSLEAVVRILNAKNRVISQLLKEREDD